MSEKKQKVTREIRAYSGDVQDVAKEVSDLSKNFFVRVLTTAVDVQSKEAVFIVAINIPEPVANKVEPVAAPVKVKATTKAPSKE